MPRKTAVPVTKPAIHKEIVEATVCFVCPACGTEQNILMRELSFSASEQECEMCGSHGSQIVKGECIRCHCNMPFYETSW